MLVKSFQELNVQLAQLEKLAKFIRFRDIRKEFPLPIKMPQDKREVLEEIEAPEEILNKIVKNDELMK